MYLHKVDYVPEQRLGHYRNTCSVLETRRSLFFHRNWNGNMSGAKATYERRTDGLPNYEADPSTEHLAQRQVPPEDDHGGSSLPAYPSNPPDIFSIGDVDTPTLMKVYKLESHLRLLGAFHQLRADVCAADWGDLGDEERWGAYVARAVHRFELWVEKIVKRAPRADVALLKREQPPLDVAMIWHSYCLNPLLYLEDGLTRMKDLLDLNYFPLTDISNTIDPLTMRAHEPPYDQAFTFEAYTGEDFVVSLSISHSQTVTISCPSCETSLAVPWIGANGKGYSQAWFAGKCPSCALEFGKEAMGVRRFCEHARTWIDNPTSGMPLAGTLIDNATGLPDYNKATAYNRRLLRFFMSVCKDKSVTEMCQFVSWSTGVIEMYCRTGMSMQSGEPTPPRLRRVLSHYNHPGLFSIDLVGATLRQGYFIWKMYELGWTSLPTFEADNTMLSRSVARYHAWLDLMSANPDAFYVPTLDIDLVWHTHMLFSISYRQDLHRVLGRIPDHEDKVEENALASGFDETSVAWKERFGVPYTYCGCLLATDVPPATLTKTLGSLFQRSKPTRFDDDAKRTLSSTRDRDSDSSHPSEHNSMLVIKHPQTEQIRVDRHELSKRRSEAMRAAAESPSRDLWDILREQRHGRRGHHVAFRGVRPGPDFRTAAYLPSIIDGANLVGGHCAAGLPGGICRAGGEKAFCGKPGQSTDGIVYHKSRIAA